MQPVLRKVLLALGADPSQPRAQRIRPSVQRTISALMAVVVMAGAVFFSAVPSTTNAANTNVLANGGFESGFNSQAGCGLVGNGWNCFTNGGAVNYSFYDDTWSPVLAEGQHSQGISLNTKQLGQGDADRYAGIYQTVRVADWQNYTLNLRGLIRSTRTDGDPYRYQVDVGWTWGPQPNWAAVTNWKDTGWYTYYQREAPGALSSFSTDLKAENAYVTIYVRVWKKWFSADEELDVNLDAITLTGPALGYVNAPAANTGGAVLGYDPGQSNFPAAYPAADVVAVDQTAQAVCTGGEYLYNGGFELGFNPLYAGSVGKGWGLFTNGGQANFNFQDDQWAPVVAHGHSSQLIAIDTKAKWPADHDRFAGIYQQVGNLVPGRTYELTLRGILRGTGNTNDPYRFEANWGYNAAGDTDWTHVSNWKGMDLGPIQPITDPETIGSYTVRFTAPASSMVIFFRAWNKWAHSEQEYILNLDAISIRSCDGTVPPPPGQGCQYVVKPGDTLGLIARRHNTTVYELARLNGIVNVNIIYVGQVLRLPACGGPIPPEPPKPPPAARTWIVKPGDTLSQIARACGINMWDLARYNGIANPNLIYVGQILKLP